MRSTMEASTSTGFACLLWFNTVLYRSGSKDFATGTKAGEVFSDYRRLLSARDYWSTAC